MRKMADIESYKIHIAGRWTLEDLYVFPRALEQVYFLVEALLPNLEEEADERILRAFQIYPWHGGYSAVGFYNQLKYVTPSRRRPTIRSISYASPGWIEIGAIITVISTVAFVVNRVVKTLENCNRVYSQIYRDAQQRKLLGIEIESKKLQLTKDTTAFILDSSEHLASIMGIPSADMLHERTGNPLISLKILLSFYRRVRTLAQYETRGKANFDGE
jgi:hypothetical protein